MKVIAVLCFALGVVVVHGEGNYQLESSVSHPKSGAAVDEVVVQSSLYIKKKPQIRRTRDVSSIVFPLDGGILRVKRQNRGRRPQVGASQSSAQAAANSNFFNPSGFGAAAANAQSQAFQAKGPLGGFGASAANTQTQSFTANKNGIQGSAGFSGSQTYNLPDGKTVNVAFSNGFSAGPGGITGSKANGITIN